MLTAADDLFHEPPYGDYLWHEDRWFSFIIPERNLLGWIYIVFRPNIGVAVSEVTIWSKHCNNFTESDYWDIQFHLPMPRQNLDDITLASGLTLKVLEPLKHYRIDYDGGRGTELHLQFEGLMPPAESHDVRIVTDSGFGELLGGGSPREANHFDQMVMVSGDLVLNGEPLKVSYPATRDGSWGIRREVDYPPNTFDQGSFGPDFGFFLLCQVTSPTQGMPVEGYVLEDGEVHAITKATAEYEPERNHVKRITYRLTDNRGKTFVFVGEPTATITGYPHFPSEYCYAGLIRWECDGRIGWGDFSCCWHVATIQRERQLPEGEPRTWLGQ